MSDPWLEPPPGCTCPSDPELRGGCPACLEPDDEHERWPYPRCVHPVGSDGHHMRRELGAHRAHPPDGCPF